MTSPLHVIRDAALETAQQIDNVGPGIRDHAEREAAVTTIAAFRTFAALIDEALADIQAANAKIIEAEMRKHGILPTERST